jgi:membrane carboxypeptidase/penicillin-binding protein
LIRIINYCCGIITLLIAYSILLLSPKFRKTYLEVERDLSKELNKNEYLPEPLFKAIISIEDKRFYSHLGVDFYSILRAIKNHKTKKRKEGASTLSQQLTRTITNRREITYSRKISEILLSVLINNRLTKKQLLISYCSLYEFENNMGIRYLCKMENYSLNNLSFNESCQIAARFKYPNLKKSNYSRYLKRVRTIEIKTTYNTV